MPTIQPSILAFVIAFVHVHARHCRYTVASSAMGTRMANFLALAARWYRAHALAYTVTPRPLVLGQIAAAERAISEHLASWDDVNAEALFDHGDAGPEITLCLHSSEHGATPLIVPHGLETPPWEAAMLCPRCGRAEMWSSMRRVKGEGWICPGCDMGND